MRAGAWMRPVAEAVWRRGSAPGGWGWTSATLSTSGGGWNVRVPTPPEVAPHVTGVLMEGQGGFQRREGYGRTVQNQDAGSWGCCGVVGL